MTQCINRQVRLKDRPIGIPQAEHFEIVNVPLSDLGDNEVLVQNIYLSVEPAMRGWVNDAPNYLPPVEIGAVMRSFAVGTVVQSRDPDFAEGDVVTGMFGWQRYTICSGPDVDRKVEETDLPPSLALGVLGLNGVTAFFGLMDGCSPKKGDTVVVSTAAGAVGSAASSLC